MGIAESYSPVPLVRRTQLSVSAHANWSQWIAVCPRCPSAERLEPHQPLFACTFCEAVADVLWPSPEMVYGIERLLMMRPDPSKRNWQPGETLVDLMIENGEHGIFSDLPEGMDQLTVESGRIRMDTLPATSRRELRTVEG